MRWPSLERPINAKKQLLVEGRTPEIFFREWIEALGLKEQVEVRDFRSIFELTPFLQLFTGYKEFREQVVSLAIVRDAEEKPAAAAFAPVCSSLKAVGLSCPTGLASFSTGTPRIGIYILPDCQGNGMLETLCWNALQNDSRLTAHVGCVESYLACLRQGRMNLPNEAKSRIWAFLAAQGKFDPLVGRAAQAQVWDWQHQAFAHLGAFLNAL
jgi:hypothetical protein